MVFFLEIYNNTKFLKNEYGGNDHNEYY